MEERRPEGLRAQVFLNNIQDGRGARGVNVRQTCELVKNVGDHVFGVALALAGFAVTVIGTERNLLNTRCHAMEEQRAVHPGTVEK